MFCNLIQICENMSFHTVEYPRSNLSSVSVNETRKVKSDFGSQYDASSFSYMRRR